jgi:uncharacterized membrane protein YGL010W
MASPFRPATELMVQYRRYHRDRRNIATHFFGIPLIVFAIGVFLARAQFELRPARVTPAEVLWLATTLWYLTRGNLLLGVATSVGQRRAHRARAPRSPDGSTGSWLACGLITFVTGWVLQFVGHYYEGRKPAFVDDLVGLLVGPMFVTGEALFAAGLCRPLAEEIERRTGPTLLRDLAHPIT